MPWLLTQVALSWRYISGRIEGEQTMKKYTRRVVIVLLGFCCLMLAGCQGNVGVGMSVGVPVGNHGHIRVGGHRWL